MNFTPIFKAYPTHSLIELSLASKLFITRGVFFFTLSLPLTSLFTSGDDIQGIWVLFIGWMGLIIFQFSWFANPLNLLALLILSERPVTALLLSLAAFVVASQTLVFSEIPSGASLGKIHIKELGLGFYFWYFSHALFFIGILVETLKQTQKNGD